jgi:hypothetical protein
MHTYGSPNTALLLLLLLPLLPLPLLLPLLPLLLVLLLSIAMELNFGCLCVLVYFALHCLTKMLCACDQPSPCDRGGLCARREMPSPSCGR